jgi:hypothetical protein
VLAAVNVPEVEVAAGRSPDAAGTEPAQRHSVPGAVVEIACVADCIGILPTEADGTFPGVGGDVWSRCAIVIHVINFSARSSFTIFLFYFKLLSLEQIPIFPTTVDC